METSVTNDQVYEPSGHLLTPVDHELPQRAARLRELGLGQAPDRELDVEVVDARTCRPIDIRQIVAAPGAGLPEDLRLRRFYGGNPLGPTGWATARQGRAA
jgi:hypothetical protein